MCLPTAPSLWASRGWARGAAQCLVSTAQGRRSRGKSWSKVIRSSQSKSLPEGTHLLLPWPCPLVDSKHLATSGSTEEGSFWGLEPEDPNL